MAIERITPSDKKEWQAMGLHHLQRYEFAARFCAGKRVLDLACGNGYGAYTLMNLGAESVEGVDIDEEAILYAHDHYSRKQLQFNCRSAYDQQAPHNGYGAIVSYETIEHLSDPVAFIKKLRQLIASGGTLIISAPNTMQYQKRNPPVENPFHLSEPTYEEFRGWVETYFEIEQEWEQSPVTLNFNPQTELVSSSGIVRLLLSAERLLKSLLGVGTFHSAESRVARLANYCAVTTEMHALLPERRDLADVFVFVARPK